MDKIKKAFEKLSEKERRQIKDILERMNSGKFDGLDIKKLKGREDIFRARKGDIRIIYRFQNKKIFVLAVERRREDTYKF